MFSELPTSGPSLEIIFLLLLLLLPLPLLLLLLLLLLQGGEYSVEGNMVARNVLGVADQWAVTGEIINA
jgi:hypothetical protein